MSMNPSNKQFVIAIVLAGIWMNVNEFIRNELILKKYWIEGYQKLNLSFPSAPINGAVWGFWAFVFVIVLIWMITHIDMLKSVLISWILGYVLLWVAMLNLGVMPEGILYWAVPWSFIEVYVAAYIGRYMLTKKTA